MSMERGTTREARKAYGESPTVYDRALRISDD